MLIALIVIAFILALIIAVLVGIILEAQYSLCERIGDYHEARRHTRAAFETMERVKRGTERLTPFEDFLDEMEKQDGEGYKVADHDAHVYSCETCKKRDADLSKAMPLLYGLHYRKSILLPADRERVRRFLIAAGVLPDPVPNGLVTKVVRKEPKPVPPSGEVSEAPPCDTTVPPENPVKGDRVYICTRSYVGNNPGIPVSSEITSKLTMVFLEYEDKIMTIRGEEAEKWNHHNLLVAQLAQIHGCNPFKDDPISWGIFPRPQYTAMHVDPDHIGGEAVAK